MTRYAKSVGAFADVKRVFDAALAHGHVRYKLESKSKAMAWRSRAYAYRKMLLDHSSQALANTPGIAPSTPYDTLFLSIMDKEPHVVTIFAERPGGVLETADGKPIDSTKVHSMEIASDDPLEAEALRLAREADIEI